jgi:hypothetical protein
MWQRWIKKSNETLNHIFIEDDSSLTLVFKVKEHVLLKPTTSISKVLTIFLR